jgi:hypothetical protein
VPKFRNRGATLAPRQQKSVTYRPKYNRALAEKALFTLRGGGPGGSVSRRPNPPLGRGGSAPRGNRSGSRTAKRTK